MEEKTILSDDGRIVRVDNPWWSFYIDIELAPGLDERRCGKWMFYFNDIEFAEEICRRAAPLEWSSRNASTAPPGPLSRAAEASPDST